MLFGKRSIIGTALAVAVTMLLPLASDARRDNHNRTADLSPNAVNLARNGVGYGSARRQLPNENFSRYDRVNYKNMRKGKASPFASSYNGPNGHHQAGWNRGSNGQHHQSTWNNGRNTHHRTAWNNGRNRSVRAKSWSNNRSNYRHGGGRSFASRGHRRVH
jgi:hypothetical protein